MSLNIREIVKRSFNDIKKYREVIFLIVILSGIPLWFFRFMILWGLIDNPHGRNFWFMDFECYYIAAKNYTIGENIYGYCFYYPPISIWFFLPFALFEFELASFVFTLINLFTVILIFWLLLKILFLYKIEVKSIEKMFLILFMFMFYPSAITLTHGQVNLVILLFLGIFYYYTIVQKNTTFGAISLNLAAIFKIWPISLAILEIFLKKSKKLLLKCFLIFCFISFASFLIFNRNILESFILNLLEFQSIKIYSLGEINERYLNVLDPNASLFNTIGKIGAIFGLPTEYIILINIFFKAIIIACTVILLFKSKKIQNENIRAILISNLLISTIFIVSNVTWIYYFTFLLFSIFFYFYILETNTKERILLFLVILLLSFQQYIVFGAKLLGGFLALIFYVFPPTTVAFVLYFMLSIYSLVAAYRENF